LADIREKLGIHLYNVLPSICDLLKREPLLITLLEIGTLLLKIKHMVKFIEVHFIFRMVWSTLLQTSKNISKDWN